MHRSADPTSPRPDTVTSAVTAMLRQAGKMVAGVTSAALVAQLGLAALGALVFLAALTAGIGCWVIRAGAGQPKPAGSCSP